MQGYTVAYSLIKNVIRQSEGCAPWSFWLWYVTPVPILGSFMVGTAWLLGKRHKQKVRAHARSPVVHVSTSRAVPAPVDVDILPLSLLGADE